MAVTSVAKCVDKLALRYGRMVSKRPFTTMTFAVTVGLLLATGTITSLTFEARSSILYVPQHSALAKLRDDMWATFGPPADPFIVTVSLFNGGDMITRDALLRVMALHEAITNMTSSTEVVVLDETSNFEPPLVAKTRFEDVCMQRYIPELGERVCAVSSILQLWEYDRASLEAATDADVRSAVSEAYARHEIDLGGVRRTANSSEVGASALMLFYYLDEKLPTYDSGETAAWELHTWRQLRQENASFPGRAAAAAAKFAAAAARGAHVGGSASDSLESSPALAQPASLASEGAAGRRSGSPGPPPAAVAESNPLAPLRVNLYSRHINEFESEQFVSDDSYLMALSVVSVILYVCLALSVANHGGGDRGGRWWARLQRLALGCMCGVSVGFSILSGFGLACYLGIPLSPVSPLVVFTLLGVSVDDMIIIFDCHVREAEAEECALAQLAADAAAQLVPAGALALAPTRRARKAAKQQAMRAGMLVVDRAYERALSSASAAISLTSATTLIALLTGWAVDFPVYSYFCGATGCCIACCFFFQATLFAPLLLLHERAEFSHRVSLAVSEALERAVQRAALGRDGGAHAGPKRCGEHGKVAALEEGGAQPAGAGGAKPICGAPAGEGEAVLPHGRFPLPPAAAAAAGPGHACANGANGGANGGSNGSNGYNNGGGAYCAHALSAHSPGNGQEAGSRGLQEGRPQPEGGARTANGSGSAHGAGSGKAEAEAEGPAILGSCSQRLMRAYASLLLRPAVSIAVLTCFCALVVASASACHSLQVGLPQRDTVPDGSHVGSFLDDLDSFWGGDTPEQISLVFKCEEVHIVPDEVGHSPAGKVVVGRSRAALDGLWQSGAMLRVTSNWADAFDAWLHCPNDVPPGFASGGRCSAKNLTAFLNDGEMHACVAEDTRLGWVRRPHALEKRRHHASAPQADEQPAAPDSAAVSSAPDPDDAPIGRRRARGSKGPAPEVTAAAAEAPAGGSASGVAATDGQSSSSSSSSSSGGGNSGGREGEGEGESAGEKDKKSEKDGSCHDDEERFHSLSRGHVCADALERCASGFGHKIVRKICPETCGLCANGKLLLGKEEAAGADDPDGDAAPIVSLARGGLEFAEDVILRGRAESCACSDVDRAMHPHSASCRVRWWQQGPLGIFSKVGAKLVALSRKAKQDAAEDEAELLGESLAALGQSAAAAAWHGAAAGAAGVATSRRLSSRRERRAAASGAIQPPHHPNVTAIAASKAGASPRAAAPRAPPPSEPCGLGLIAAHRMVISARMPQLHEKAYEQWLQFNQILSAAGARGYAYHPKYEFGYVDKTMLRFALTNLAWATVAILCVLLAFLSPPVALISTVAVLSIDTILFGMMVVLQVRLNSITLISLLIALALAIDYSCHIGHAFEAAPFETRALKAAYALETMGASILSAGSSTLLGTLFLAFSESAVFRTFFLLVWGTILWGLVAGLAIVPAALGLFGPVSTHTAPGAGLSSPASPHGGAPLKGGSCSPHGPAAAGASPPAGGCTTTGSAPDACAPSSAARTTALYRSRQPLPTMSEEPPLDVLSGWRTAPVSPWFAGGSPMDRERYPPPTPFPPIAGPIRAGQPPRGYDRDGSGELSPRYNSACRGALL